MMNGAEPDRGELGQLLRQAGSSYDPQGVEELIEGVLAAPAEIGATSSWHVLVADPMVPALAGALEALRAAKAKAYRNGLSSEDFELLPRAVRRCLSTAATRCRQPRRSTRNPSRHVT